MSKIKDWLEEDKLILLEGWSRDGLSLEQIAKNIGIAEKTIYEWKNKESKICEALKKGKEVADYEVENAVFKRATGYTYEEKTYEDGVLKKKVIKEVPPDTTAQIYWLKHRQREKWGEKEVPNNNEISKVEELLTKIENEAKNDTK